GLARADLTRALETAGDRPGHDHARRHPHGLRGRLPAPGRRGAGRPPGVVAAGEPARDRARDGGGGAGTRAARRRAAAASRARPPSGTWEQRRADLDVAAADWLGPGEAGPEAGVEQLV